MPTCTPFECLHRISRLTAACKPRKLPKRKPKVKKRSLSSPSVDPTINQQLIMTQPLSSAPIPVSPPSDGSVAGPDRDVSPPSDGSVTGPAPSLSEPAASEIPITLVQPSKHRHRRPAKLFRSINAAFRAFPILTTTPTLCHRINIHRRGSAAHANRISGASRLTGTLFGHRKARVTLAIQDNPRSVPFLLLELPVPTAKFMTDMGSNGLVRITLECEKKVREGGAARVAVLEEPTWTAYINGKNVGYGARREATEVDLKVMQMLHAASVGAGVLPESMTDAADGELTYMRAHFDRVVGNKDSETFYLLNPDGNSGPELSIFFVRI